MVTMSELSATEIYGNKIDELEAYYDEGSISIHNFIRYIFSTKPAETDRNRPIKGIYWELWTNGDV